MGHSGPLNTTTYNCHYISKRLQIDLIGLYMRGTQLQEVVLWQPRGLPQNAFANLSKHKLAVLREDVKIVALQEQLCAIATKLQNTFGSISEAKRHAQASDKVLHLLQLENWINTILCSCFYLHENI